MYFPNLSYDVSEMPIHLRYSNLSHCLTMKRIWILGVWNLNDNTHTTFFNINLALNTDFLDSSPTSTAFETEEQINVSSAFITKRGALLDTYQDESAIKVYNFHFASYYVYDVYYTFY